MFSNIFKQEEAKHAGTIIPQVTPEYFSDEEFLKKGFITEPNYQTRIIFQ